MARKQKSTKDMVDQFTQILAMNLGGCTVTVCLGSLSKDQTEPRIEQLQLTKDLTEEFASAAKKAMASLFGVERQERIGSSTARCGQQAGFA